MGFNFLIVMIIILINFVLRKIIEALTLIEKSKYYTEFLNSKIYKVFILLFCNTGLMIVITVKFIDNETNIDGLFGENGVVYNIQFIMMYSLIIPLLFSLFHPLHLIKTVRYWNLKRKFKKKRDKNKYIQTEANYIYEKNRFDIDYKYFSILKTIGISFFYQLIIPYGLVFAMIEMVLFYVTDRFSLTRRCLRPKEFDFTLTLNILSNFDMCLILLPLGYIIFYKFFFNLEIPFIIYICLILTIFEKYVISVGLLFSCCKNCQEFEPNFLRFQDINVLTYNQLNPVTMDFYVYDDRNKSMLSVIWSRQNSALKEQNTSKEQNSKIEDKFKSNQSEMIIGKLKNEYDTEKYNLPHSRSGENNLLQPSNNLSFKRAKRFNLLNIVHMISNRKNLIGEEKIHFDDEADTINYLHSGKMDLNNMNESKKKDNRRLNVPLFNSTSRIYDIVMKNNQLNTILNTKRYSTYNSITKSPSSINEGDMSRRLSLNPQLNKKTSLNIEIKEYSDEDFSEEVEQEEEESNSSKVKVIFRSLISRMRVRGTF